MKNIIGIRQISDTHRAKVSEVLSDAYKRCEKAADNIVDRIKDDAFISERQRKFTWMSQDELKTMYRDALSTNLLNASLELTDAKIASVNGFMSVKCAREIANRIVKRVENTLG